MKELKNLNNKYIISAKVIDKNIFFNKYGMASIDVEVTLLNEKKEEYTYITKAVINSQYELLFQKEKFFDLEPQIESIDIKDENILTIIKVNDGYVLIHYRFDPETKNVSLVSFIPGKYRETSNPDIIIANKALYSLSGGFAITPSYMKIDPLAFSSNEYRVIDKISCLNFHDYITYTINEKGEIISSIYSKNKKNVIPYNGESYDEVKQYIINELYDNSTDYQLKLK